MNGVIMIAWIEFTTHEFRWWSVFTFWTVVVSVVLTLGFTVAVFIGGLGDLKYLLGAMGETSTDESDDGSVPARTPNPPERGFEVVQDKSKS